MMKLRVVFILFFFALATLPAVCQKLHYSNYNYAPTLLSPAETGAFNGTIRVGAALREQFREFIFNPFRSLSAFVDSPVSFVFNERQWVGLGASFHLSDAGDLSLQETSIVPSLSYHLSFDDQYNTVLGIGVNYALTTRQINDAGSYRSEKTINGIPNDPDQNLINDFKASHNGLSIGVYLKKRMSKKLSIVSGLAVLDLINSGFKYNSGTRTNKAPLRFNAYTNWEFTMNKKLWFTPSLIFQRHDNVNNIVGAVGWEHLISEKKNIKFNYRGGYRLNDALIFGAGVKFKQWDIGLNYDMTVSSARQHNGIIGALELGAKRIFAIHPQTKLKVLGLCPRL